MEILKVTLLLACDFACSPFILCLLPFIHQYTRPLLSHYLSNCLPTLCSISLQFIPLPLERLVLPLCRVSKLSSDVIDLNSPFTDVLWELNLKVTLERFNRLMFSLSDTLQGHTRLLSHTATHSQRSCMYTRKVVKFHDASLGRFWRVMLSCRSSNFWCALPVWYCY